MVKKIAISGNIASGKSQVEKILLDLGFNVYDSDKIAHDVLNDITEFYNYDVFTEGKIDRKKLGAIVFSNPDIKLKLEKLTHPKIKENILKIFEENKDNNYVFVSVPLLYEAGFENIFDKVIFISVNEDIQLKRLMNRNNFTREEALLRINSQQQQSEKIERANFVIENNKTIDELKIAVEQVINLL